MIVEETHPFYRKSPSHMANPKVGSMSQTHDSEAGFLHFGIYATCIYSLCLPGQVGPWAKCPRGDTWEDGPPNSLTPQNSMFGNEPKHKIVGETSHP